jgi:hypothetical protein
MGDGFDTRELDEFNREFILGLAKKFPKDAKKFMRRQGNKMRKEMRNQYKAKTVKRTGNLLKGVMQGRVYVHKDAISVRVYNRAPHAHLIEHGHVMADKYGKPITTKSGEEIFVTGKHPAGTAVNKRNRYFYLDAEEFVDEMLEGGRY